jgi:hypothetical protein
MISGRGLGHTSMPGEDAAKIEPLATPEPSSASTDPLVAWRLRRDTGVRADVVVYSAADFEAERAVPNALAYEAASAGVALYER